jgi:sugar lactone lactonase YvrE
LRNVLGFHVDRRNGWLWALDMGFLAGEAEAPVGAQKVMVFELASGQLLKTIALDGVADRAGSFLNDIAVDERRRVAYVSDSGFRSAPRNQVGLIVVDHATGTARRVLDGHASLQIEPGVKVMSGGSEVWPGNPLLIGVNGIALSPDGQTLYWTVTTGTQAWAVPTAVLRRAGASDAQIAREVRSLGVVGGNTDGIVTDAAGQLYITDVTRGGIVRYSPKTHELALIAANGAVRWPDTPAWHPGGDLVFTASALNQHFAGQVKAGEERYELWRLRPRSQKAPRH